MTFCPVVHHRRSIRYQGYDYSTEGAFFITICTYQREYLLSDIFRGEVIENEAGRLVKSVWLKISKHFSNVECDEAFIVMPDHIHGIIWILDSCRGGVSPPKSEGVFKLDPSDMVSPVLKGGETPPLRRPPLGSIIGYFKYQTTKILNERDQVPGRKIWQRNYYERIIRDEEELSEIRRYIMENPLRWEDERPESH